MNKRVVIITGGATGLGRILVDMFIEEGYLVCFTYKNSKDKAVEISEKYGKSVLAIHADASSDEEAFKVVEQCVQKFGTVDVLINNAAGVKDSSLLKHNFEKFSYTIENVLYPVFNYCRAIAPYFVEKRCGSIINIGSINGLRGREGNPAYSAAKAGIVGFTKTIAKELGEYEINCNVVAPGFIDTDGQANTSELIKQMVLDECAIRKLTKPEEVGELVLFLASEKAKRITGQVYKIDCGQYI